MWVSLRGSLLKVPKEHVRPTTGEEDLGRVLAKELSLEMIKDIKSGKLSRYHDLSEELPGEEDEQPFEAEVKPMEALDEEATPPPRPAEPVLTMEEYTPTSVVETDDELMAAVPEHEHLQPAFEVPQQALDDGEEVSTHMGTDDAAHSTPLTSAAFSATKS